MDFDKGFDCRRLAMEKKVSGSNLSRINDRKTVNPAVNGFLFRVGKYENAAKGERWAPSFIYLAKDMLFPMATVQ